MARDWNTGDCEHQEALFHWWGWLSVGTGCPGQLQHIPSVKKTCIYAWSWAPCCGLRSLLTSTNLWFCEIQLLCCSIILQIQISWVIGSPWPLIIQCGGNPMGLMFIMLHLLISAYRRVKNNFLSSPGPQWPVTWGEITENVSFAVQKSCSASMPACFSQSSHLCSFSLLGKTAR